MTSSTTLPRRITVKIGSNVLTRPDGTLDVTRMSALVDQICALRQRGIDIIVVSSGAVACGRSIMRGADTRRLGSVGERQLFSAVGQVRLMDRYCDLFATRGVTVGQVLTAKESFATRRHYLNQRHCMSVMLDAGVVPIVNENDTVSVTELMFTDNDELSGLVAAMMDCDMLVILSNIDGIFTGSPSDPASKLIPRICPADDVSSHIATERSGAGRGGMVTKHRIARKVAAEGIAVVIANGKRDDVLTDLVLRDHPVPHTLFVPDPEGTSGLKRWIAHSGDFAKGCIRLNADAVRALTTATASVLPVGVVGIDGTFERDDLVSIADADGTVLGLGRVSCDSDQARADMGQRDRRPLIHYDYLTLD